MTWIADNELIDIRAQLVGHCKRHIRLLEGQVFSGSRDNRYLVHQILRRGFNSVKIHKFTLLVCVTNHAVLGVKANRNVSLIKYVHNRGLFWI